MVLKFFSVKEYKQFVLKYFSVKNSENIVVKNCIVKNSPPFEQAYYFIKETIKIFKRFFHFRKIFIFLEF